MKNRTSQLATVSGGQIEYTLAGKGPAVLVSHGTLGGYDQSLAIVGLFNQEKFCFVPVSRAGYLRSAPSTGRTPNEQARSFVELLDSEGIAKAAILGLSGGAPAAICFAQNYPDRCWALVLLSAIIAAPPPMPAFFRAMIRFQDVMMRADWLWRFAYKYGLKQLVRSNGLTAAQAKRVLQDAHLRRVVQGIYRPITNASQRRKGMRLDHEQINALPEEPNYALTVPVFIGHTVNDPLAPVAHAQTLATSLPDAHFVEMSDGGHIFFVVHSNQLIPQIEAFLFAQVPSNR
ncbi:alpha/beta fold hydrolase [Candidatus Leptofilum sp.]|uniref:alpha/beta fold hydrolase n=1 Tax=Candidatus Leptofilum sp. TaxID=3241576 RepID=UPI003B59144E